MTEAGPGHYQVPPHKSVLSYKSWGPKISKGNVVVASKPGPMMLPLKDVCAGVPLRGWSLSLLWLLA